MFERALIKPVKEESISFPAFTAQQELLIAVEGQTRRARRHAVKTEIASFDSGINEMLVINSSHVTSDIYSGSAARAERLTHADRGYYDYVENWMAHFHANVRAPFDIKAIVIRAGKDNVQLDAKTIDMAITAPQGPLSLGITRRVLETQRLTPRQYALALILEMRNVPRATSPEEETQKYDKVQREKGMSEEEIKQSKAFYKHIKRTIGERKPIGKRAYKKLLRSVPSSYSQEVEGEISRWRARHYSESY